MSSKSAIKLLVTSTDDAAHGERALFKWVAILTGSKNTLKGAGFLLGSVLLGWIGFVHALWAMAGALALSSPFAFLVWLPHLLGDHRLWVLTLPLALAGAVGLYGLLTAGASALLTRREPDLLARVLGEE